MIRSSSFATLIFVLIWGAGVGVAVVLYGATLNPHTMTVGGIALVLALIVSVAVKIANQWERVGTLLSLFAAR